MSRKDDLQKAILEVLEKFADHQINLKSAVAREELSLVIVDSLAGSIISDSKFKSLSEFKIKNNKSFLKKKSKFKFRNGSFRKLHDKSSNQLKPEENRLLKDQFEFLDEECDQ